jgi:ABC-type transport system involved in multi-copper enzyme maturation permease subunit
LLVGGVAGLYWYRQQLSVLTLVMLCGVLVLVAAVLLRRGWLKLFGPVLFYDMVRSARRGRYILMRFLYAVLLLGALWFVYTTTAQRYAGQDLPPLEAARLAEAYFDFFMAIQLITVVLLTPAYVAGAIADEKVRKTLEFLLATDLRSREILLSKLCSRLANLAVFLLTGLPILSFMQFLGGIDPNLVVSGFVATGLTALGLAGVSILASTYCKRPRDAIAVSYLTIFAYYGLSTVLWAYRSNVITWTPYSIFDESFRQAVLWFADTLSTGNLIYQYWTISVTISGGQNLAEVLPAIVGKYAIFQGIVSAVCIGCSVWRLRPVAVAQMSSSKKRRRRIFGFRWKRPRVSDLPMLWKELHIEGGLCLHWVAWLIVLLIMATTLIPAVGIMIQYPGRDVYRASSIFWTDNRLAMEINVWARSVTAAVGSLTLLAVAVRAATCISGERDRQTFDSLLTTPMSASEMLAAKALGNVAAIRLAWIWLGSVWLLALATGGLHPFALPFLLGAWLIYAFFASMLGCWFSIVSRSSQRAIMATLLSVVGLTSGHWLVWCCCGPMVAAGGGGPGSGEAVLHVLQFQAGITPSAALGFLTFYEQDFGHHDPVGGLPQLIGYSLCGLFVWLCVGLFLWHVTLERFRRVTLRGAEAELEAYISSHDYRPRAQQERRGPPTARQPGATITPEAVDELHPRGARLIEKIQEPRQPPGA